MAVHSDVVETIAGFALFADLSGPELEAIAHTFDEAWFGQGERILRQGVTGSGFYVIVEGAAVIRVDGVDRAPLKGGDFFGEISCLVGDQPVADIVATQPLRCLILPCAQLEAFLLKHPRIMYRLLQREARKLKHTTKWVS
jgi:CRP-like cAMP-binding protein